MTKTKMKKKPVNVAKAARTTIFYIFVVGVVVALLLPFYFIVSLSFLSTREAYEYPLPMTPALNTQFKLEYGNRGYLLSVYDRVEGDYETVLDTNELQKMSEYMKYQLATPMTLEDIEQQIAKLEETQDEVYFTRRRNLLSNYQSFFGVAGSEAVPALIRSLQICALTIIISLSIGGMAGYAFARYAFKGKDLLKFSVLFVRMFPGVAIAIPMIKILVGLNFYDKPIGLSLVYAIGNIALTVWITASIFMGIPESLEEAAQVFGATKVRAFLRVTLPLALPGLAAAAMYSFLGAWNETLSAIILTQFNPTFSVIVFKTVLGAVGQVNLAAAGGMAMALPAIIFTFFIRRYIRQMWGGVTI